MGVFSSVAAAGLDADLDRLPSGVRTVQPQQVQPFGKPRGDCGGFAGGVAVAHPNQLRHLF